MRIFNILILFALCIHAHASALIPASAKPAKMTEENKIVQTASEAYFYGFPLVLMETTKNLMTNVAKPDDKYSPINQFHHTRKFIDASFHDVVSPNNDTLYSIAWLDLKHEPLIMHVPDSQGKYFLLPILNAWTNVITSIGTRTTGNQGGDFALVGPNWTGEIPNDITIVRSPTNLAWIIGRIQTNGPKDYPAIHQWQDKLTLVPLSSYGKPYTPPAGQVDSKIDMAKNPLEHVNAMDISTYFTTLNKVLVSNPPEKGDSPGLLEKFRKIGVGTGETFDLGKLDEKTAEALRNGYKHGQFLMKRLANTPADNVNGWDFSVSPKIGNFGRDYMLRAKIAYVGLGANLPADAVYALGLEDQKEDKLTGKNNYVIHFEKDNLPPAKAFWSLTMYNDDHYFVANSLNRYAIHYYDDLARNEDGSVDILLQREEPAEKKNNWLPAPEGGFNVILRIYWPEESVLNGKWKPPVIQKAN